MKLTTILAGAAALALTFGGVGTAAAQAKAPLRAHKVTAAKKTTKKPAAKKKPAKKKPAKKKPAAKKPAVVYTPPATGNYNDGGGTYATNSAGDGTGQPNVLDALDITPGEGSLPDLGLLTDVVQGLLGQPL
jgi:hypothetical protein